MNDKSENIETSPKTTPSLSVADTNQIKASASRRTQPANSAYEALESIL